MTELLDYDRLRRIAVAIAHPLLQAAPRQVPTLQWALDPATGRPVAQWVLQGAKDCEPAAVAAAMT